LAHIRSDLLSAWPEYTKGCLLTLRVMVGRPGRGKEPSGEVRGYISGVNILMHWEIGGIVVK
jgi:hypothetical protein